MRMLSRFSKMKRRAAQTGLIWILHVIRLDVSVPPDGVSGHRELHIRLQFGGVGGRAGGRVGRWERVCQKLKTLIILEDVGKRSMIPHGKKTTPRASHSLTTTVLLENSLLSTASTEQSSLQDMQTRSPHAREPFDHPATDATRQQRSQRKAMVRGKRLSVLLESKQHISLPVKRPAQINGSAIGSRFPLRQLTQRTFEMDEAMLFRGPCDANRCQQVAQADSCPHGVSNGSGSPIESLLAHTRLSEVQSKGKQLNSKAKGTD